MSQDHPRPGTLRVVLIEDNPDDVLLIQRAFQEFDRAVIQNVFSRGGEALRWLAQTAQSEPEALPHLVFLDINLPGKTGFEILGELRTHASLGRLPVVILSTSDLDTDASRAYATGATSFITKPPHFSALRSRMREALEPWLEGGDSR